MHRGDAQRITATVKWFNRTKGFGFITANDGSGDVFLPAAVLAQAGHDEVGEGATIVCDVSEGPKGRAVVNVLDVDSTTVSSHRGPSTGGPRGGDRGPRPDRVARGFGFISPKDGGKDVFVHVSALRRSGLESLTTGQNVHMLVQEARRGREAASVELA
jgi:CspA family cold shock protein